MGRGGNILGVIVAFFESVKYTNHLIPVAFLRVYLGYYYFSAALSKYQGDYLTTPHLRDFLSEGLAFSTAPHWYQELLSGVVATHWDYSVYIVTALQFGIGISYLLGYMVRPFSVIAMIASVVALSLSHPDTHLLEKTFLSMNLMLCWIGAGRCLGFDYYFYKRMRGILW